MTAPVTRQILGSVGSGDVPSLAQGDDPRGALVDEMRARAGLPSHAIEDWLSEVIDIPFSETEGERLFR
jgi:hypothetical protein